jgi:hypothetical protein
MLLYIVQFNSNNALYIIFESVISYDYCWGRAGGLKAIAQSR